MYTGKNRKRNRLIGRDYSQNRWYFITICVQNKIECLGEIKNEEMQYNRLGQIVLKYWQAIPAHYRNIFLDEWIIMPNHVHGIVVIDNPEIIVGTEQCSVLKQTQWDTRPEITGCYRRSSNRSKI